VLETGTEQPESIHLYEACGYRPIPCWGKSADNPRSRCYEKVLEDMLSDTGAASSSLR
jgi:hypothetical protein